MDRLFLYFLRLILFFPCNFGMLRPLHPTISQVFLSLSLLTVDALHSRPHPPHKYLSSYLCRRQLSTHTLFPTTPSTQVFIVVSWSSSSLSTFPSLSLYLRHHIFHHRRITFHRLSSYLCHNIFNCCRIFHSLTSYLRHHSLLSLIIVAI